MKIENTQLGKSITKATIGLDAVEDVLQKFGWETSEFKLWNMASKDFTTAVGVRTASVMVTRNHRNSLVIFGNYGNTQRNFLDVCDKYITEDAGIEDIRSAAVSFASEVDQRVDATYARKLYLNHGLLP
jgi:hypothetical protein